MVISPPPHFRHAGELRRSSVDPRRSFLDELTIDLRKVEFIRPPAVLWCVIFPLLAAHSGAKRTTVLVPENMGVCVYLRSLGLFDVLKAAGVEVDDRGVPSKDDAQAVLPLTGFTKQSEVDDLANQALDALSASGLGAPNLHPLVSEVFAELALNAVDHSESPVGSFGFVQFYRFAEGQRFVCGVADGGIGIRRSLERNPSLREQVPYDWTAIELALRERVSGTGDATRGIGLYGVAEDMRLPRRQLIVHSGQGSLDMNEDLERHAQRSALFPGTLVYASIPT